MANGVITIIGNCLDKNQGIESEMIRSALIPVLNIDVDSLSYRGDKNLLKQRLELLKGLLYSYQNKELNLEGFRVTYIRWAENTDKHMISLIDELSAVSLGHK